MQPLKLLDVKNNFALVLFIQMYICIIHIGLYAKQKLYFDKKKIMGCRGAHVIIVLNLVGS